VTVPFVLATAVPFTATVVIVTVDGSNRPVYIRVVPDYIDILRHVLARPRCISIANRRCIANGTIHYREHISIIKILAANSIIAGRIICKKFRSNASRVKGIKVFE